MTMYRLPVASVTVGERALDEGASRYLARVLRLRPGTELEIFDPRSGERARATLRDERTMVVHGPVEHEAPAPPVILVQGLPKADKLADVVRDATELGATLVIPTATRRSIVRVEEGRRQSKGDRWRAVAAEAARQCGRARAPEVLDPLSFEEALAVVGAQAVHRFVLWERATAPLGPMLRDARREQGVAFVVGPEGGLDEREVEAAAALGFAAASLGPTILRTETVAAAVLGAWLVLGADETR
jgi:16S rRNA (uracil1498-N3)-methyltransferase